MSTPCRELHSSLARLGIVAVLVGVGCGDGSDASGTPAPTPSGSATGTTSTTAPPAPAKVFVSFVAEHGAGQAPASLGFSNTTAFIVSLHLGGANFLQLDASDEADPQLSVTADVDQELRLGFHENKDPNSACNYLDLLFIAGADALEPGSSYVARVSGDVVDALSVDIVPAAKARSYSALRAQTKLQGYGSELTIRLRDEVDPRVFLPGIGLEGDYQLTPAVISIDELRYRATDGHGYDAGTIDVTLDGAYGFSMVLATEPVTGAHDAVELHPND